MPISPARVRDRIPKDHPVQPLAPGDFCRPGFRATCGTCKLSWDDGTSTALTPTPAGRCPFEAFHRPSPKGTAPVRVVALPRKRVARVLRSRAVSDAEVAEVVAFAEGSGPADAARVEWAPGHGPRVRRVLCLTIDVPVGLAPGATLSPAELVNAAGDALTARGFTFVGGYVEPEPSEDERSHGDGAIKLTPVQRRVLLARCENTYMPAAHRTIRTLREYGLLDKMGRVTAEGAEVARTIGAS